MYETFEHRQQNLKRIDEISKYVSRYDNLNFKIRPYRQYARREPYYQLPFFALYINTTCSWGKQYIIKPNNRLCYDVLEISRETYPRFHKNLFSDGFTEIEHAVDFLACHLQKFGYKIYKSNAVDFIMNIAS